MQYSRGGDARAGAQGLQQHMHLGFRLAAGTQSFPHEGHRIQPQHIDAGIGEVQHDLGNFKENLRVSPVQIPLVFVESGPDPFAEIGVMGEIAGGIVGKNLDQRLFIGLRHVGAVEHQIHVLRRLVALCGALGPVVFLGGMVQHKVDTKRDAALAQLCRNRFEIIERAIGRVDVAIIHHRIAAIGITGARLQTGHEMDVGDAQFLQVIELFEHAIQVAGKAVDVEHIAGHIGALKPVRFQITLQIQ